MADLWSGSPYGGSSSYDQLFQNILQAGAGAGWNPTKTKTTLDQYGTDFTQQFQNAVGRPPTPDEINQFYTQAVNPIMNTQAGFGATDPNAVASQYVPQAFQSQIQQNQQSQLPNLMNQISSLASGVGAQTASQLADPKSGAYQTFSGAMNNLGISPSSGAFQAGEGATVGNAASSTMQQLLSSLGGGAISGNQSPSFQNLAGMGQQAGQGMAGYNQSLNDFNLQAQLGRSLGEMSQPSGTMKDIGMASSLMQGIGSLGQGAGAASTATSYVCMELIKRDLLCESDMDDFHVHIMPAMFKKARAFWKYAMDGKKLVDAVNERGLDWKAFKPLLFDRVMEEPDPCKAVDLYADACHQLCISSDPSLWDGRVNRTSSFDSLPFLPLLFFYTPFLKALWKCIRVKMLFVYDKSRCEAHYGSR